MNAVSNTKVLFFVALISSGNFQNGRGCNPVLCTDPNHCVLASDGVSCRCASGHYGQTCKEVEMNVICQNNYTKVMVIKDFFDYHHVKLETVHLRNQACHAFQEVVSGITYFSAAMRSDNYTLCGGLPPEKNITHITFSNALISGKKAQGLIARDPKVEITFKCVYPYIRRVSLPFPVSPFSSETVLRVSQLEVTVVMRLYKNGNFTEAYGSSPVLRLRDKVFVEVKIASPEELFALKLLECWATQSPDPQPPNNVSHLLILNGCIEDGTVVFVNGPNGENGANGVGSAVYYAFDMFRFVVEPFNLYLHCKVRLCTPDYEETCIPDCKRKTKRDLVKEDIQQGLLSYGPIRVEGPVEQRSTIAKAANKRTSAPRTAHNSLRNRTL
ncbi:zona pellucida glycoprotein d isoform X2 [Amia ocellicauda]|uniref:zona pellucida glycoprotein d isoform X2 n=1 Tax=Amia ocellicauda TaxID=2972642 RepID=UPI003464775C